MRWPCIPHVLFAAAIVLALAGCSRQPVVFVSEGNEYSVDTIGGVFDSAVVDGVLGTPTSETAQLRSDALVALRREGDDASAAADLITSTFAPSTAAVPVYVERAGYEGEDAVIVAEAMGPKGGSLSDLRVWVVGADGQILYSGTR